VTWLTSSKDDWETFVNWFGFRRHTAAALGIAVAFGLVPLAVVAPASAAIGELFISEYVEGSSNNKALEIYNGTGAPVDLTAAGYSVRIYFNGATTPSLTIPITGVVDPGEVFVLAQSTAGPEI
jgi:predicted extracellular nuclease